MFQFVRMQPPWTGWAEYLRDRDRNVQFPPTSVWASTAFIMSATTKKPGLSKLVQDNLNLCKATSICAGQPQSVQNNLNLCKTTSIHAKQPQFVQRKKTQKVTAYFRRLKRIFEPEIFSLARGYI